MEWQHIVVFGLSIIRRLDLELLMYYIPITHNVSLHQEVGDCTHLSNVYL